MSNPITLPTLAEGASLKLSETHNPNDVGFATVVKGDKSKNKPPVDAVVVDHGMISDKNDAPKLRVLAIVVKGTGVDGKDLVGRDCVFDMGFDANQADYTLASLRLMGFNFRDVDAANEMLKRNPSDPKAQAACAAAEEAFMARLNDPMQSEGCGTKVINLKFEESEFPVGSGNIYRRLALGGITQPMSKLDTTATKAKLGGIFSKLAASKDGPPKRENNGGAAPAPRNGSSPPPAVQGGSITPDSDMPF